MHWQGFPINAPSDEQYEKDRANLYRLIDELTRRLLMLEGKAQIKAPSKASGMLP